MRNRYPGLKPFSIEEQNLFFGRDEDSEELLKIISLEQIVVLYSKSGLGKSSLINAGIIPRLIQHGESDYFVVRFGSYVAYDDKEYVQQTVLEKFAATIARNNQRNPVLEKLVANDNSLWSLFKSLQMKQQATPEKGEDAKTGKNFVLFFDQFEELFSYPPQQIAAFASQFAELLRTNIPVNYRKAIESNLKQNRSFLSKEEMTSLHKPMTIKVVIAIRSDRMSLLNNISNFLPDILHNCFELKPLSREQAENAIVTPAHMQSSANDEAFVSPAFDYEPDALNKILNYLTNNNLQSIETFQLQVICQYCENKIINYELRMTNDELKPPNSKIRHSSFVIRNSDLGNLQNIFKNHYDLLISKIPSEKQHAARVLIEDNLIVEGNRVSLPEIVITTRYNVDSQLLQQLVNTFLLRAEPNTVGGISYELSHDTLVAPILETRQKRVEDEEREKQLRAKSEELRIANEKAEKERIERERERRRQRRVITIVGSVALVAIVFLIIAVFLYFNAEKQKKIALEQTQIADKKKQEAIKSLNDFINEQASKDSINFKDLEVRANTIISASGSPKGFLDEMIIIAQKHRDSARMYRVIKKIRAIRE